MVKTRVGWQGGPEDKVIEFTVEESGDEFVIKRLTPCPFSAGLSMSAKTPGPRFRLDRITVTPKAERNSTKASILAVSQRLP